MLYFQQQTPETAESEHQETVLRGRRVLVTGQCSLLGGGAARPDSGRRSGSLVVGQFSSSAWRL